MAATKYYLGNKETGKEWDCQPKNFDGQMQNVDGVGFSKNPTYQRVDRYFINTDTEHKQNAITGEMVFLTEQKYNDFLDFIGDSKLYLKRVSEGSKVTYIDVEVVDFKRNDENRFYNSFCLCDIDLSAISPWYKLKYVYENSTTGNSKTSPYTYPYTYSLTDTSVFNLDIASKVGAIVNIRIFGEVDSPEWSILSANSGLKNGKYNDAISTGEYLEINSTPSELGVWLHKSSTLVVNAWENCDRLLDTFAIIPTGHTQIEILSSAGTNDVKCAIEVLEIVECP